MSFLSVLKKVGTVFLGVEHVAVPLLSIADPALAPVLTQVDGWVTRTFSAVASAEATITTAQSGGLKSAAVQQDFLNGLATAQTALAVAGKTIQYDPALYQKVINDFTAAYNDAAAFKAGWKIVDLPKAAAAA